MQVDCNDRKRKWINKKLFGCPVCQRSYYVVLTENIKNKYFHYRELTHTCSCSNRDKINKRKEKKIRKMQYSKTTIR